MSEVLTIPGQLEPMRRPEDRLISVAVLLSVAVHAAAVGFAFWLSIQKPAQVTPVHKPVSAKLIRRGKARDKNLLPRMETKQAPSPPPQPAEPPPSKTTSKAPPTPAQPAPVTVKSAIATDAPPPTPAPASSKTTRRAEQQRKNREALAAAARRQSLFNALAGTASTASSSSSSSSGTAPPDGEEPEGDPDGDPEGDSSSASEGERYFGLILSRARRYYDVSKSIPPRELIRLKATVILYIGPTGGLLQEPVLQTSSGNDIFDQEVLVALKKAAPFGPPPQNLAKTLRTVGVAIEATP